MSGKAASGGVLTALGLEKRATLRQPDEVNVIQHNRRAYKSNKRESPNFGHYGRPGMPGTCFPRGLKSRVSPAKAGSGDRSKRIGRGPEGPLYPITAKFGKVRSTRSHAKFGVFQRSRK